MNVRLKNSSAISPTGASIYNKVVENMATGKTRTGRQEDEYCWLVNISRAGQHIRSRHRFQPLPAPVHLPYNHIYAIGYTHANSTSIR